METGSSTFMLIFRETTPERYQAMSAEERRTRLDAWNAWCDELAARGKLLSGNPLLPEARVVARAGEVRVVDGPFAEAKELIGGYLLVEAEGVEEAVAMAQACPNLPYGMEVEVRPVAAACHLARSLGWSTMRAPA